MPVGATSFREALRMCAEVFHQLKTTLKENGTPAAGVGDEGGYAPNLKKDEDALKVIVQAIEEAGYKPGEDFKIAIDAASSEWWDEEQKLYIQPKSGKKLTQQQLVNMWKKFADNYPIISLEDGMAETDWEGWAMLTKAIGDRVQLVGDDLFVTNVERLATGIEKKVGNAILIKVNQIGTLTETLDAIQMANRCRLHRHRVSPLRRDRGCHHRRHRRGPERRPDQDRRPQPHRPRGQVQPAAPHRGGAGRRGRVSRHERFLQPEVSFQVLQHSRPSGGCAFSCRPAPRGPSQMGRRFAPYKRFCRRRKPWRRANLLRPSILNNRVPIVCVGTQWEAGRRGRVSRYERFLQPEVSIVPFCTAAQPGGCVFSCPSTQRQRRNR